MTEQVTYGRSIHTFPYWGEDLRRNSPLIYLCTHKKALTTADINNPESVREVVIKTNFQAKTQIAQLGEIVCESKSASSRYEWKMIVATVRVIFSSFGVGSFTLCVLVFNLSGMLKTRFSPLNLHNILSFIFTIAWMILFFLLFKCIQKTYVDGYVVFQRVSYIPNSMAGFDPNQLANNKREDGWEDLITLETITPDRITSSQILRIGQYASTMIPVLQQMLTANYTTCPKGEIPHPYEPRSLFPDEKDKFLREVSAFFSIPSEALEKCWNVRVENDDIARYAVKIKNWDSLPTLLKSMAIDSLEKQLWPIKRKQVFLKLLTDYVAQKYFSKQFRCSDVSIPTFTRKQIEEERALEDMELQIAFLNFEAFRQTAIFVYYAALDYVLRNHAATLNNTPPTPTSVQSGNAGPP